MPDFTSLLSDEGEAQAFVAATASSLPRRRRGSGGHDADEDGAPVGKVFLFSTKHDVPGIYKALAAQFHGRSRLLFAWTSPDTAGPGVSLMQKMNVSGHMTGRLAAQLTACPDASGGWWGCCSRRQRCQLRADTARLQLGRLRRTCVRARSRRRPSNLRARLHLPYMHAAQVRRAPAMAILFPLPPKPLGAEGQEPAPPRKAGDMAMQVR